MSQPKYFSVKNWEDFQHYKDRSPPWIKLHRDLLRDYEFSCLQDASKLLLMQIWLLASQLDNKIPTDTKWLGRQLPYDGEINLKPLFDMGYILPAQDDSNTLAGRKQSAIEETETETETERPLSDSGESDEKLHKPKYLEARKAYKPRNPNDNNQAAWKAWKARIRAGVNPDEIMAGVRRYAHRNRVEGTPLNKIQHMSTFLNPDENWKLAWSVIEKVPPIDDVAALARLARERDVNLPPNCKPFDARKIIAKQLGMSL